MIQLRDYQREAIDAIYAYFMRANGNPIVALPTGTGKSVVIGEFIRGACTQWTDTRVVMLTHVKELIAQNFMALNKVWPDAPAGIYSAGLNKRDIGAQILCAGIQSIAKKAKLVQHVDLVIVDECHLIPRSSTTMYGRFLRDLKAINPYLKIVGFTATPYRMDTGMLHEGKDALFDEICYEMTILEAVDQGYLTEVIPKRTDTQLDVSGVGTRGGEFIAGQLERAVDIDEVTQAAVDEIVRHGEDRGSWLIFCAGVDHAMHVRDAINARGISCETVTGDTPSADRARILNAFKAGHIKALTNMSVLTTGFDAPGVDLLAFLRPTKSPGLFVQMIGRGTRLANGKENCLALDFAGNTARHGPVDRIRVSKNKNEEEGEAPIKTCPECATICYAGVRECPDCGFLFPPPEPKITREAATDAILSSQIEPLWIDVENVEYWAHTKPGKPTSLRVTYSCGLTRHSEWICLEHSGYPRRKAVSWWSRRAPGEIPPATVDEALQVAGSLPAPKRIAIVPAGRYKEIVGHEF